MTHWVLVIEGASRRALADGEQVAGSSAESDVLLDHPTVSRRHATLEATVDGVAVRDLGSSNGTFVDGKRLDGDRIVGEGSRVDFGSLSCRFEAVESAEVEAAIDLVPAEEPAAKRDRESPAGPSRPTFSVGSARELVSDALPRIVASLEVQRRAPADERERAGQEVVHAAGRELFDAFPCRALEILRVDGSGETADEEALCFRAVAEGVVLTGEEEWVERRAGALSTRVLFTPELHARGFESLVELVTRLAALALPAGADPVDARPRPTPPPLPSPASLDPAVIRLYDEAARIARGEVGVLIGGETGTGKEVLARYLHDASPRAREPWVAINCAALPEDLLEAELFGIEKGVATGVEARAGKFESADGGTLFLDEIGDMSPSTQAKILRVLQEGEVYRLGARAPRPARARILAATNHDLRAQIDRGEFRLDLYHRIADCRLHLPPLRERLVDLPNLAAHFLTRAAEEAGVRVRGISRAALDALVAYPWPGNVRQLEREMARAALFLEDGELLQTRHLHAEVGGSSRTEPTVDDGTLKARLDAVERRILVEALERHDGNVRAAARDLGTSKTTFYRRISELSIEI